MGEKAIVGDGEHYIWSKLGDSISIDPEITALRRLEEESGYIEFCNKGHVV